MIVHPCVVSTVRCIVAPLKWHWLIWEGIASYILCAAVIICSSSVSDCNIVARCWGTFGSVWYWFCMMPSWCLIVVMRGCNFASLCCASLALWASQRLWWYAFWLRVKWWLYLNGSIGRSEILRGMVITYLDCWIVSMFTKPWCRVCIPCIVCGTPFPAGKFPAVPYSLKLSLNTYPLDFMKLLYIVYRVHIPISI